MGWIMPMNIIHYANNMLMLRCDKPTLKTIKWALKIPFIWNFREACYETPMLRSIYKMWALVKMLKSYDFKFTNEASKVLAPTRGFNDNYILSTSTEPPEINIKGLKMDPYKYQLLLPHMLKKYKGVLCADTMGLGKTIETIISIEYLDLYPSLIVVLAGLKINWERELNKWLARDLDILTVYGEAPLKSYQGDIVIINPEILQYHADELSMVNFKGLFADESQAFKNNEALRTEAIKKINAEYKCLLTGTPMQNRPKELISQLQIIGRLRDICSEERFLQRYCCKQLKRVSRTRTVWDISGSAHEIELNSILRGKGIMIRRTKEQVLPDLPKGRISIVNMEIDNRGIYNKALEDLLTYVYDKALTTAMEDKEFLKSIDGLELSDYELKQKVLIYATEKMEAAERAQYLILIESLKQVTIDGKLSAIKSWLQPFVDSREKNLVFLTHRKPIKALSKHFKAPAIYGGSSRKKVQEYVDRFQNDKDLSLLFAHIKSGGVGHTMTSARNVTFCELGWSPEDHAQAQARIDRIGQKREMTFYYLIGANTIDERIFGLLQEKKGIINKVIDGKKPKRRAKQVDMVSSILKEAINENRDRQK
jgi:SWI/SNF-related matrix-associated actin-dependent regulator 1 of chromatin subfamily A